jgi:hypothetical protein
MTMRAATIVFAATTLLGATSVSAACYSMHDPRDELVYRSSFTPIDLSFPISQEMARRFPGHRLLITDDADCKVYSPAPGGSPALYGSQVLGPSGSARPPGIMDAPGRSATSEGAPAGANTRAAPPGGSMR